MGVEPRTFGITERRLSACGQGHFPTVTAGRVFFCYASREQRRGALSVASGPGRKRRLGMQGTAAQERPRGPRRGPSATWRGGRESRGPAAAAGTAGSGWRQRAKRAERESLASAGIWAFSALLVRLPLALEPGALCGRCRAASRCCRRSTLPMEAARGSKGFDGSRDAERVICVAPTSARHRDRVSWATD